MQLLQGSTKLEEFLSSLALAPERLLLLDYDGTLAPFVAERESAYPYPAVTELIGVIGRCTQTHVAIVTGRRAEDIPRLLPAQPVPEIWGSHGLERLWPDGNYARTELPGETQAALVSASQLLRMEGLNGQVERKPGSVAVHWRNLSLNAREEIAEIAGRTFSLFGNVAGLEQISFDGGLELRTMLANKGKVVREILAEHREDAAVCYLGDDRTDEDAFRVISGRGLGILVRPDHRETCAEVWLKPPDEVVAFLETWIEITGGVK